MYRILLLIYVMAISACTVKAVGDPKRPITIEAHVTIDVKSIKDTAVDIEDYVSGKTDKAVVSKPLK